MDIIHYGIDILGIFFLRIGIVEAQITNATKLFRHAKIHTNGLGMTYMKIAIRFRRETRLQTTAVFSRLQVVVYNLLNKVQTSFFLYNLKFLILCHIFYFSQTDSIGHLRNKLDAYQANFLFSIVTT